MKKTKVYTFIYACIQDEKRRQCWNNENRVMTFVCLRIERYNSHFSKTMKWVWNEINAEEKAEFLKELNINNEWLGGKRVLLRLGLFYDK